MKRCVTKEKNIEQVDNIYNHKRKKKNPVQLYMSGVTSTQQFFFLMNHFVTIENKLGERGKGSM